MSQTLVIRADASTEIGCGHVMRCLALAQAWQDGGNDAIFLTAIEAPALARRLKAEGFDLQRLNVDPGGRDDLDKTIDATGKIGASKIVVDGYVFDADYQKGIKDAGLGLLFIDDTGQADRYHYHYPSHADLVVNPNIYADERLYANRQPHTQLLLGPTYVMLRREFRKRQRRQRHIPETARKILLAMGGGDSDNATLKVIEALGQVRIAGLEAVVAVGVSNPHFEALQAAAEKVSFPVRLKRNVTDMPKLLAWADMAVCAGGGSVWEMAFMGLPALGISGLSRGSQELSALDAAEEKGLLAHFRSFGESSLPELARAFSQLAMDRKRREEMIEIGQATIDGEGAPRVVRAILEMMR